MASMPPWSDSNLTTLMLSSRMCLFPILLLRRFAELLIRWLKKARLSTGQQAIGNLNKLSKLLTPVIGWGSSGRSPNKPPITCWKGRILKEIWLLSSINLATGAPAISPFLEASSLGNITRAYPRTAATLRASAELGFLKALSTVPSIAS